MSVYYSKDNLLEQEPFEYNQNYFQKKTKKKKDQKKYPEYDSNVV